MALVGRSLSGTKAGNERNDAIRHKILCLVQLIETFKHTQMLVRSKKPFLTYSLWLAELQNLFI